MFTSLDQNDSENKVKTFDNGHGMPWEVLMLLKVEELFFPIFCIVGLSSSLGKSECDEDLLYSSHHE